jgi:hypothetical protein
MISPFPITKLPHLHWYTLLLKLFFILVYVCIFVYIYIHIYKYTDMYKYVHIYTYLHMQIHRALFSLFALKTKSYE